MVKRIMTSFNSKDKVIIGNQRNHLFISRQNSFHLVILNNNYFKWLLMYIMHAGYIFTNTFNLLMTLESKESFDASLRGIIRHPVIFFLYYFYFWYRKTYTHVGIKCNWKLVTVWASHCAFKLTMHQINDYWLISL